MSCLDIEKLLEAVTPESPAGSDLEYDPAFDKIIISAKGKPEQIMGNSIVPAVPSDWKSVCVEAPKLLARSKDLRIAILLARALLNTDGWVGFRDGLVLVRRLLETYWDSMYPALDPEDDYDPTIRINALATLCDHEATLRSLFRAPLVTARGLGSVNLRNIQIAKGELSPLSDEPVMDAAMVVAIFMECPIEELKKIAETLNSAREHLSWIDTFLSHQVGSTHAPDLSALATLLKSASIEVGGYLASRGEVAVGDVSVTQNSIHNEKSGSAEIRSREDAARMMDKISEYFRKNEPSSPVPLLMNRAKRLSSLGFMEILKDIAPDGLRQAQNIGGIDADQKI